MHPRCPSCKALRQEWYQTLTEEGFFDIEKQDRLRTTNASHEIRKDLQTTMQFDARCSYYQWARNKLNEGRFDSTKDRLIWQYHSEGVSRREMSPKVGLEQSWVTRKIHKIESYLKMQAEIIGSVCFEHAVV